MNARLRLRSLAIAAVVGATPLGSVHASPAAPDAPSAEVRKRAKQAAAAIVEERYDDARAIIEEAEAREPDPFVFLHGVLLERLGNCAEATDKYQQYIELGVPEQDQRAARAGIERCAPKPEAEVVQEQVAEPDPVDDTVVQSGLPLPDPPAAPRPWWADPAGATLTLGGVAVVGAGGIAWGQSGAQQRAAEAAGSLSTYDRHGRRAERLVVAGVALVSIGGALLIAGAIRYGVVAARRARGKTASVPHLWPPGGASIFF